MPRPKHSLVANSSLFKVEALWVSFVYLNMSVGVFLVPVILGSHVDETLCMWLLTHSQETQSYDKLPEPPAPPLSEMFL